MFHSLNISNVNPCAEISVADRLRCPSCETVIRAIDAEMLAPWGFRIVCRNCRRHFVACKPAVIMTAFEMSSSSLTQTRIKLDRPGDREYGCCGNIAVITAGRYFEHSLSILVLRIFDLPRLEHELWIVAWCSGYFRENLELIATDLAVGTVRDWVNGRLCKMEEV